MSTAGPAIRRQLIQMVLFTSGAVLLLTVTCLFAYDFLTFRQTSQRQLDTLGRAIAANSTAALAEYFPGAHVTGMDSSSDMIKNAKAALPKTSFCLV